MEKHDRNMMRNIIMHGTAEDALKYLETRDPTFVARIRALNEQTERGITIENIANGISDNGNVPRRQIAGF